MIPSIMAFAAAGFAGFLATLAPALASEDATWSEIRTNIIGDRIPEEGGGLVTVVAPTRAEDAALVPIEMNVKLPDGDSRRVTRITLVVDENPAPLAGVFRFGEGRVGFSISARVRVNSYSYVRAIAETDDGGLYMDKAYVKAAGGCSAPALKDPEEANANLGLIRFRTFTERAEAQIQVRHPNYSGMQMDQITRLYTPAWFVENLSAHQGKKLIFTVEGGISMSEDPTFRFSYVPTDEPVTVHATDNQGNVFEQVFPASGS